MTDWTETYRPATLTEVRGNDSARDDLQEWAETWDDHREAVVLHGSPGVGKTSAAHALANDMGWETVELNASDQRTADDIERFAGRAAKNSTLGGSVVAETGSEAGNQGAGGEGEAVTRLGGDGHGRQLIILDEADNIHGNYDRGGARAITQLVSEAEQPIVLIANDYYEMSRGLRNACQEIEFRDVSPRSIVPVLRDICRREDVGFETEALQHIAEENAGDLRGAIKDLQAAAEGCDEITVEDVVTGGRDRTVGIFDFLDAVLKEESAESALRMCYDVEETPDDLTKWVEENLPKVYEGRELARAYDHLAAADRWLGRVRATQEYGYWRYATDNLAAGVAAARDGEKGGWTRFGRPQFWPSTDDTADEVVQAIAQGSGTSIATARREILPFLSAMIHHCKPRELTVLVAARYDFDEAAVAFVTGSGEDTNKVASIVEDAQALREETMSDHTEDAFGGRSPDDNGGDAGTDEGDEPQDAGQAEMGVDEFGGGSGQAPSDDDTGGSGGTDDTADPGGTEATAATDDEPDDATDEEDATSDQQSGLGDFV